MKFRVVAFFALFWAFACSADTSEIGISDAGVGGIDSKTHFDAAEIAKLFPGFDVRKSKRYTEGEPYPVIEVRKGGQVLLVVNPAADRKQIFSVQILSADYSSGFPWKLRASYLSVYGAKGKAKCNTLEEEMSGMVSCNAPRSKNVMLVFNGQWDGAGGVVPSMDALAKYKIEQIAWIPGVQ